MAIRVRVFDDIFSRVFLMQSVSGDIFLHWSQQYGKTFSFSILGDSRASFSIIVSGLRLIEGADFYSRAVACQGDYLEAENLRLASLVSTGNPGNRLCELRER